MQAYRAITHSTGSKLQIDIPSYLQNQEVEIIVLPYNVTASNYDVDFNDFFGVTNIGTEKIDHYLNSIREEWEDRLPY